MASFLSKFTNKVDGKGRVSVPADFRDQVAGTSFNGIVLRMPLIDQPFIEGEDIERTQALSDQLYDSFDLYDEEQAAIADAMLTNVYKLPFDPEGRVKLPDELRDYAGIELGGQATFIGRGPQFQIWNPDAYQAHNATLRSKAMAARGFLKTIKRSGTSRQDGE